MEKPEKREPPRRSSLLKSILGAAIGVQSSEVQRQDFSEKSPAKFIVGGLIFGVLFVVTLVLVVKTVLSLSS